MRVESERHEGGEVRALLRQWRSARGKSQLNVALEAGISQRHLSFIESGRSTPSRDMLIAIAETLEMPLRERNALLLAAGYAPVYAETGWDDAVMRSITSAVDRMLRAQEPYPAVLMDRYWNVIAANAASPRFFGHFIDMHAGTEPRNLLHLMFDPAGMRPFIHDWETASRSLIRRVHREAVGHVIDDRTRELLDALHAYPGVAREPEVTAPQDAAVDLPMIPLSFVRDGIVLNYFSMVTTVGTPQTTAAEELRVECLFPADDLTEKQHLSLMQP
ncbi:MAG: helix-turn-helix transcriptional regulator [Vulcanimicrobiaceae bacterium]